MKLKKFKKDTVKEFQSLIGKYHSEFQDCLPFGDTRAHRNNVIGKLVTVVLTLNTKDKNEVLIACRRYGVEEFTMYKLFKNCMVMLVGDGEELITEVPMPAELVIPEIERCFIDGQNLKK